MGVCCKCRQKRRLENQEYRCKACSSRNGENKSCSHKDLNYVDGICVGCYQDQRIRKKLTELQKTWKPACDYNELLFNCYIKYIRRCRLKLHHLNQAKRLIDVLSNQEIPRIRNWGQIYKLSEDNNLRLNKSRKQCAAIKIGYILQEIGVLGPRRLDYQHRIERGLLQLPDQLQKTVATYLAQLSKTGRADGTLIKQIGHILQFYKWLQTVYPQLTLLSITKIQISEFLAYYSYKDSQPHSTRDIWLVLRRFYDYLMYKKNIFAHPCNGINIPKPHQSLTICSDLQIKQLIRYIKNTNTNPERAFLLSLILFFGFNAKDLIYATILPDDKYFSIKMPKIPRSVGRHYYNREAILRLPSNPQWFSDLQKRFYNNWVKQYKQTTRAHERFPLLMPRNEARYNHPVSDFTLRQRILKATMEATGSAIPPKVLRQTGGHLYVKDGDGSILSRLGWSPYFAFAYTWLPRQIHYTDRPIPKKFQY